MDNSAERVQHSLEAKRSECANVSVWLSQILVSDDLNYGMSKVVDRPL